MSDWKKMTVAERFSHFLQSDLQEYIKEAEVEREHGGQLERVPRHSPKKHRCTPPSTDDLEVRVGDVWHCDCGNSFVYRALYGPDSSVIYAWREVFYPLALTLAVILHGIAFVMFVAALTAIDSWFISIPTVFLSALLSFLGFFVRDTLKR